MNIKMTFENFLTRVLPRRGRRRLAGLLLLTAAVSAVRVDAGCVEPPSGLVGWWAGDGNALDTASTNNGTLEGGATATGTGEVGECFTFNGTTAYVSIPDSAAFHPTNLTIEAWVLFTSLSSTASGGSPAGQQYIVFKQNTRSDNFEGIYLGKERGTGGDHFVFGVSSSAGASAEADSGPVIATNVWYHVAGVRGSNFVQLYLNGQLAGSSTVSFAQNYGTLPLLFGSSGESYWDHKLNGRLDEVSLYNRALASNEIAAIFAAGAAGKCKGFQPPVVTIPPASQSVAVGSNAFFTVTATGTAPLSYQWQFNGTPIAGATTTNLTVTNVQVTNGGSYTVVVTNLATATTSAPAILTVLLPPVITVQPQSATNLAGSTVVLSAAATGSAPLSYQWTFNNSNLVNSTRISGAQTATLTISNALVTDTGNYVLLVSNAAGSTNSLAAGLTVNGPPTITALPGSQTVLVGANVNFSVTAAGSPPLGYHWLRNGSPLSDGGNVSGSATANLSLTNVQLTDTSTFQVIVSNLAGSTNSALVTLTVNPPPVPPSISAPPPSQTVTAGTNVSFSVTAAGTAPLSFQWQKNNLNLANGGNVSGATTSILTLSNVQSDDAANYSVIVTNVAGSTNSGPASLTVNVPPAVTAQPVSVGVMAGTNVSFSVGASGTAPLVYEWRFNGSPLSDGGQFAGTATPTMSITNVGSNNGGNYSVLVSNVAGATASSNAVLAVTLPGSCYPAPTNLVGWWPGDGNANDIIGGNDGTLQGGATAGAPGEVGPAFGFNGTTAYVSIPDSSVFHPTNFTVEAWVLFTSLDSTASGGSAAGQQYIVFKQNTRYSSFEGIYLGKERGTGGDHFAFAVSSSAGVTAEADSGPVIATNVWYHIAGVRGTNTLQLYLNGALVASASVNFAQDYGTLPLYFGSSGETYWDHKLSGSLDEVSLYDRALAASEVAAIYAAGSGGKCKGAVAPAIVTQPTNQVIIVGGSTSFTVVAAGTQPLAYQWYKDGVKMTNSGTIAGATGATLSLANLQLSEVGNYTVYVSNPLGTAVSQPASLITGLPPANDDFAAAQAISGSIGSVAGNNFDATKEPGEPNHAGNPGGASVWYSWTAPSTSPVTFDTCMSSFDTLLAVYTGSAVSSLTLIAANDNVNSNNDRSRLTFTPVAGTVYHIAVDGAGGVNGNLTLRWVQASVALPDLSVVASAVDPMIVTNTFAPTSCAVVEGLVQSGTRTLIRFTTETENSGTADLFFGDPSTNSLFVWAPCHAHYHFQNYMSYRLKDMNGNIVALGLKVGFCVLDVFRWSPSAGNSAKYSCTDQGIQVGWGDVYDSTLDGQWIDITGIPAGNYNIEIECNPQGIIQESNYSNNIIEVPIAIGDPSAPPLNDDFANAQALLGGFSTVAGNTANATKEPGEPNHAGNPGGHSIWYTWLAPSTKSVTIDTINSSFNTLLAAYTGTAVNNLTVVASNDDLAPGDLQSRVTFNAAAGTTYQIAVDGYNGAVGNVVLTLNQTIQNDNFANGEFIGGVSGVAYGSTFGATKEPGEPDHAGNPGGNSIWYFWTAPINGNVTFNTDGSSFDTLLAVYTGTDVSNLTLIAADPTDPVLDQPSTVTFTATELTRYAIAIDGYNGTNGDSALNWNLAATGAPNLVLLVKPNGPQLTYSFLPDGEMRLQITGPAQQTYRIETSCDLQHWTPSVTTLADATGHAYFTDKTTMRTTGQSPVSDPVCTSAKIAGAAATRVRFYRAIETTPN